MTVQTATYAHFKLLEPASWLVESDRGDPQKAGPCGGSNTDWGKPSYVVTKAVGGQKLHLKLSPLRGAADYEGPGDAAHHGMAG